MYQYCVSKYQHGDLSLPKDIAAKIAMSTVVDHLIQSSFLKKIFFVCFDQENFELMQSELVTINSNR